MNTNTRACYWLVVGTLISPIAQADYIQSLGVSEQCAALGGACVATQADFGTYYSNPAGATEFTHPLVGGNFRIIDTTDLKFHDSGGDHSPVRTNTKGDQALAPTLAGYVPYGSRWNFGLALGAPFAITGDWAKDAGIHRYDMSNQALFLLDLTPTVAYKINDRVSIGLGLNVTALKHLRTETLIPNTFLLGLPPALGGIGSRAPATPSTPTVGTITLQTDRDMNLGIPPDDFETAFNEIAATLGVKYEVSDRLTVGAVYRSVTRTTWKGNAEINIPGVIDQTSRFSLDLDMPGHAQIGAAYQLIPNALIWSVDYQRTFWSRTHGFGSTANVQFQTPLLGLVKSLQIDYNAHDTSTYHTGLQYKIFRSVSLLVGYAYDQHIFDNSHVDILTYDSDRQIVSFGATVDLRESTSARGWTFTPEVQLTHYNGRAIGIGESQNLGGVSHPNLDASGALHFVPNDGAFTYGGSIWAFGIGAQYTF